MDSARFFAEYARTSGLIGRLEDIGRQQRQAYAAGDQRMFGVWVREYSPIWQSVQSSMSEIGESSIRAALNGDPQYMAMSDMFDELTRRFVAHTNAMNAFMEGINRENPAFLVPPKSGGCYVATAVYGSYDAPEVLVLREFRDRNLAASWWGRRFIAFYYFASPPLARRLEGASGTNGLVRRGLDSLVRKLEQRGR